MFSITLNHTAEHDQAMAKFSRVSKKKDSEKVHICTCTHACILKLGSLLEIVVSNFHTRL